MVWLSLKMLILFFVEEIVLMEGKMLVDEIVKGRFI